MIENKPIYLSLNFKFKFTGTFILREREQGIILENRH